MSAAVQGAIITGAPNLRPLPVLIAELRHLFPQDLDSFRYSGRLETGGQWHVALQNLLRPEMKDSLLGCLAEVCHLNWEPEPVFAVLDCDFSSSRLMDLKTPEPWRVDADKYMLALQLGSFYPPSDSRHIDIDKETHERLLYRPTRPQLWVDNISLQISEDAKKHYLSAVGECSPDYAVTKDFLENVTYIPYHRFVKALDTCISHALPCLISAQKWSPYLHKTTEGPPFIKSSFWVLNHVLDRFPIVKRNMTWEPKSADFVVYFDDASYSGDQIVEFVFSYNENNPSLRDMKGIVFIIPFMSNNAEARLHRIKSRVLAAAPDLKFEIFRTETFYTLAETIGTESKSLHRGYSKYAIYFDHKIADGVSTLDYVLKGRIPALEQLEIIEKYPKRKEEQIIALFPVTARCLIPPYKPIQRCNESEMQRIRDATN